MEKKCGRKSLLAIVAILAAVVGAAVAIGVFLKKKAKSIGDQLDYDGSLYYEDDDYFDEEPDSASEEPVPAPAEDAPSEDDNAPEA